MAKMREHKALKFTDVKSLEKKAAEIRLSSLAAINKAGLRCSGNAMSGVEILVALYYGQLAGREVMKFSAGRPAYENDYLVVSKGDLCSVQYSVLADLECFDKSELGFLGKEGAMLSMNQGGKIPGVNFANFVPGKGVSVALGLALALRRDREQNRVYCVVGEDEVESGELFEALAVAAEEKLDNLVLIIDDNKQAIDAYAYDKCEAFGSRVIRVVDGHNLEQLLSAFARSFTVSRRPVCIWCRTKVGKGVVFAEGKESYRFAPLSDMELDAIKYSDILAS